MNSIYDYIKFPIDSKADKKLEIDNFLKPKNLSDVEKNIFKDVVISITVKNMLNNSTTELKNKSIKEFTYQEIIVLEVEVNNPVSVYDVAIVVGRAIFYPTMLFIKYGSRYKIGYINNSFGKVKYDINVVKDIMFTGWINEKKLSSRSMEVLKALTYDSIKNNNFYDTYRNYVNVIREYKGSYISIDNAIKILNDKALKVIPNLLMKLKLLCVSININNSITGLQVYKTSRLDKYIDDSYNYTLLCVDDLYSYIESSKEYTISNFETLLNAIKNQYRNDRYENQYKNSICKNCVYYNGYCCENKNVVRKRTTRIQCQFFEGR